MQSLRTLLCLLLAVVPCYSRAAIPVIYCTDLFHPHVDPDDHWDLATLFALPEFDVKAIILDQGDRQLEHPGAIPLGQMMRLTQHAVPFAIGLGQKLSSPADAAQHQPAQFQDGVTLLLKALRESTQPVTIITAGSVRDLCAAFNREPGLFKQKVNRVYINIGNANPGESKYNVDLDPAAYVGILRSGLPIYLALCLPMEQKGSNAIHSTWWRFRQSELLPSLPTALQNFFIYALQKTGPDDLEPLSAIKSDLRPWRRLVGEMDRNMWCTASLLHAAGREVKKVKGAWTTATGSAVAEAAAPFDFVPASVTVDDQGRTRVDLAETGTNSTVRVFQLGSAPDYTAAMRDCLRELLRPFPVNLGIPEPRVISRGQAAATYQAFPDVCRLRNGALLAVFYAGYGHVSLPRENFPRGGRICSVTSTNEGRTWSSPRILFDGPHDDRDPHIAQLSDGTLICSFFTYRPQADSQVRCDTSVVTSRDGGETWDTEAKVVAAEWPSSAPVRELPDGTCILGVYREDAGTAYGGIIRSTDQAQTWSAPIPIGKGSNVRLDAETDFVLLKDGTLYAALRGDRTNMHYATSSDLGLSWSNVRDIGFAGHCPHFTRLGTGEILLAHRLPQSSFHVSRDDGHSWQGPYLIDQRIGAYPSTVELRDGSVLVVYYQEGQNSAICARRFQLTAAGPEYLPLLPASVDLRSEFDRFNLPRWQQGSRPTCSSFTVAGALEFALAKLQGKGNRLSVEFLNWAANRSVGDSQDGGFFSDLWQGFTAHGICSAENLPYTAAFNPSISPSTEAIADAKSRLNLGLNFHWIKEWDVTTGLTDSHLSQIKATLLSGWPVCAGLRWPRQERWKNGVMQFCGPNAVRDGHSVLLVGYQDDPAQPGGGVLIFRNTAGEGRDGLMPYTYAQAYMNDAAWIESPSR